MANKFQTDFPVSNGRLDLIANGTHVEVMADEGGNYAPSLDCGRYLLKRVLSKEGKELLIDKKQAMSFSVSKGKNTRFDVMVRAGQ